MTIYFDDDGGKIALVARLRKGQHHCVRSVEVGMAGASDPQHLVYAVQKQLVILTRNHDDFEDLHHVVEVTGGQHPGILVVRWDNDPTRDMNDKEIVSAIGKLERSGMAIVNQFHILNQWR